MIPKFYLNNHCSLDDIRIFLKFHETTSMMFCACPLTQICTTVWTRIWKITSLPLYIKEFSTCISAATNQSHIVGLNPTDRFIGADCPQLVKEHDSSEDTENYSFQHQQWQENNWSSWRVKLCNDNIALYSVHSYYKRLPLVALVRATKTVE